MINGKTISLIIPCRNEAQSLGVMLKKLPKYVDEVLVVDNESSDGTARVAKSFGARVVKERRVDALGIGYGFAHQIGALKAKGDILVTMDGDGTYPLKQIGEVVRYLDKRGLDFVTCSRFPLVDGQAISWFRKLGVVILNTLVSGLYVYRINDILSGMWLVRAEAWSDLELKEGGWDFSPEIKLNALLHPRVRFGQYHVHHYRRENDASKQQLWVTGFNHLTYIARRWVWQDSLFGWLVRNVRLRFGLPLIKRLALLFN
jgi:glycosyltransferase involved in cell wall biosynthesis